MSLFILILIFFVAFFGNLFVHYNILPNYYTLTTELSIIVLFLYSLIIQLKKRSTIKIDLWYIFIPLLLAAVCSSLVNNNLLSIKPIIGLRLLFRFYIFYLAILNLTFSEKKLKLINLILFYFFITQLPAQWIRFYYYGINELSIGTWGSHGGGPTAIVPIIALGYLIGLYVFYKKKFLYIILSLLFISFGIIGEKRVLFIVYPIAFILFSYLIYSRKKKNIRSFFNYLPLLLFSLIVGIFISALMLKTIQSLNPEKKEGSGSVDFLYAFNFAKKYTTSTYGKIGGGRIATTIIAYKYLIDGGIERLFWGYGPGSLTKSVLEKKRRFKDTRLYYIAASYGLTGLVYVTVEYGLIGLLSIIIMFIILINRARWWYYNENDSYWQAIAFGTYVFSGYAAFITIFYNTMILLSDFITPIFYYFMSLSYIMGFKLKK